MSKRDVPWIQEMIELLLKSLPFIDNPPLYTFDTVQNHPSIKESVMCFDSVLFMDRMRQGGDGGFLTGFLGSDWMKALAYKQFEIHVSNDQSGKYVLLFA